MSDAPSRRQHAEARSIGATVVADDFQCSRALFEHGIDQHLWHANQAKPADRERCSVRYVRHGLCRGRDDLVDHDWWGSWTTGLSSDIDYPDYVGQERCSTQGSLCVIRGPCSGRRITAVFITVGTDLPALSAIHGGHRYVSLRIAYSGS